MERKQFLKRLEDKLKFLTKPERDAAIKYYDELIADAAESGRDEGEFIAGLGPLEAIARTIAAEQGYPDKAKSSLDLNHQLRLGLAYMIIGIIGLALGSALLGVVSFGISLFGFAISNFSTAETALTGAQIALYVGQLICAIGIWLLVVVAARLIINKMRPFARTITGKIATTVEGEDKHE